MIKILFMCVANSARSQLAEGLAKEIFKDKAWIESAGSQPKSVNPLAIEVLKEIDVDISRNYSKTYESLSPQFVVDANYIITLCAEEVCPVIFSLTAKKLQWPHSDPAGHDHLSKEEQLNKFRITRDLIKEKIMQFKNGIAP